VQVRHRTGICVFTNKMQQVCIPNRSEVLDPDNFGQTAKVLNGRSLWLCSMIVTEGLSIFSLLDPKPLVVTSASQSFDSGSARATTLNEAFTALHDSRG
jgi:hypothetical protein